MTFLSVNVNKLATLRNSRGKNTPDVAVLAAKILNYGAHGITVHPRPDGRHIRLADVEVLNQLVRTTQARGAKIEFNVEGYPSPDFIELIHRVQPAQATLVPDPPEALTSNAGWDLARNEAFLKDVLKPLRAAKARVSLFVEPGKFDQEQQQALKRIRPERIELYTEAYADAFDTGERDAVVNGYRQVADFAAQNQIGVNAGHDLNQRNLGFLLTQVGNIAEVSIGHALICEALEDGLEKTIKAYLKIVGV